MFDSLSRPGPILFCQVDGGPVFFFFFLLSLADCFDPKQLVGRDTRLVWEISLYKQTPRLLCSPAQGPVHLPTIITSYLPPIRLSRKISQILFPGQQINKTELRHHYSLLKIILLNNGRFTKNTCDDRETVKKHGRHQPLFEGNVNNCRQGVELTRNLEFEPIPENKEQTRKFNLFYTLICYAKVC